MTQQPTTTRMASDRDMPSSPEPAERIVLIVDDDRDNREGYAEYLALVGFQVYQASDGIEALERAIAVRPDVVLLDLALPGMDGWEVARLLRADPRTGRIPVIALSACVFPADIERATDAGCVSFLNKPCYPETVADEIRRVLASATDRGVS